MSNRRNPALILGAAVLVTVLAGALLYFASAARVSSQHAAALSVLESARKHNNGVYKALTNPALKGELSTASGARQVKAAMDDYRAQLGGSIRTVESDSASLKDQQAQLQSATHDPLAFAGRSQLSRDQVRVEAAAQAFESAGKFLSTVDSQMRSLTTLLQALVEFDDVARFVQARDFSGGLALVPQLRQQVQDAGTLARGDSIPPQLKALADVLTRAVDHLNQALTALQKNDAATAAAMGAALQADGQAADATYDQAAFDAFEHKLLDPYKSTYEAKMRKAGFAVITGTPAT
jgi:hypothetical protein